MAKYTYKPNYYLADGRNVKALNLPIYYLSSVIPAGGNGTMQNPYNSPNTLGVNGLYILGNGLYHLKRFTFSGQLSYVVGSGMNNTVLDENTSLYATNNGPSYYSFKDLAINKLGISLKDGFSVVYFDYCRINQVILINSAWSNYRCKNCIIWFPNNSPKFSDSGQNSYLNTDIVNIINSLALYDNCQVTIDTQARLTTYLSTYAAFDNCQFKIGNETNWMPLTKTTETELRAEFVARCQAQGWTVPTGSEFVDTNMPMYRWVFSTGSSKNGVPLEDRIIHNFEKRRFVTFGYETKREGFIISANAATKDSFNIGTPNNNLEFTANALTFPSNADITNRILAFSQSNIKWLGGKYKLTALDIVHNMPVDFGVMIDNTSTIDFTPVNSGSIAVDELYIVRSTDKQYASITYNGIAYDTAIANNNNIFKGVVGVTAFTITSGNAVVYKVSDFVQHQTFELRIVNKIPSGNIAAGTALTSGYWYLVEHDTDQSNTTDYVTYGGVNYPVGGSFLASGTATFTKSGNVHLRRCWKDAFDYETETLDKVFWQNEQKPKWCKIAIGDTLRCFMKSNSASESEMQTDANGEYLTTGHPDFYKNEGGIGGVVTPSYPVQGTYMQLRLTITTTNPM